MFYKSEHRDLNLTHFLKFVKPFLSLECEKLELHVFDTQIVHLKNLTRKVTLPHAKTVFIHETFTTQENLYSDSLNSAKAPTLRHRPPLYSWREALPSPRSGGKNNETQTKSSININCKKIKQATVKNQFKSSAKLPTQTRKVLHDHKHVS